MFTKYRELNLSLIPLILGQKRPVEVGWTKFCDRLPTEAETEKWDEGKFGFGLALGLASNLMAVDIDSDDEKVLRACKVSPVRKRGRKGETRFFKYNSHVSSTKVAGCIDILAHGRQTVLPPSVHPDTGQPYFWITPDTLENYQACDLPEFTPDDLTKMREVLEPERFNQTADSRSDSFKKVRSTWREATSMPVLAGARNTAMTSVIGGLFRCGLHPKDIYEYVQYLNQTKFRPPLDQAEVEQILMSIMHREYKRRTAVAI